MSRVCVVLVVLALAVGPVLADEASHKKAAEEMLDAMDMDRILTSSITTMMDAQIKANPNLAPFKDVMKKFFEKHMSYKSLKDDLVKIYVKELNEDDLKQLTKFYKSPIGKKLQEKTPSIMRQSSELGMKRVQDNMKELEKMIEDAAKDKQ